MALTIIAEITAKDGQAEVVKAALQRLIPITRGETGCINYDCHQDNENPAHFVFYENWETRDLWQAHMNAPHMKVWGEVAEVSVEDWSLTEASQFE